MRNTLIHPSYFPSISHTIVMAQSDLVTFEIDDNYQKQSNRNRMYIYSPNGIQMLNIPIQHSKTGRQKTRDVKIETAFDWQKQHYKSLEAAYRSSPFFEYFEDYFMEVFETKFTFLLDLNYKSIEIISKCLGLVFDYNETQEYFHEVSEMVDFRHLINGKKDTTVIEPYPQVFEEKHGFINNLSVIDLLCNEGNHALTYLKNQKL